MFTTKIEPTVNGSILFIFPDNLQNSLITIVQTLRKTQNEHKNWKIILKLMIAFQDI